jgi:hypothetical protein
MDVTLYAKAISNLLGNNVGFSVEGVDYSSFKINGNKDKPSETAIVEEVARLQAEQDATQYQRDRAAEYPSINALVVALWEGVVEERMASVTALEGLRQAVKTKYPKP